MKTIDTKSLLLGVLAASLILTLTSGKVIENNDNIDFLGTPYTVGIYNKSTKTIYVYEIKMGGKKIEEKPSLVYKLAEDGSSLTKRD